MGFSRVIEVIMKSKKPLIGHNMIFDIAFILRQFVSRDCDLPKTYDLFAKEWKKNFPQKVYDTKVLAASTGQNIFSKTDLKYLYDKCKKEKKLCNNLQLELDKNKESVFGLYDNAIG